PTLRLLQRARSSRHQVLSRRSDFGSGVLRIGAGVQMTTIAVDAMGGDQAPRPEVDGSLLAAREYGLRILLVGQPLEIRRELARHSHRGLDIEIVPASEVIGMTDS